MIILFRHYCTIEITKDLACKYYYIYIYKRIHEDIGQKHTFFWLFRRCFFCFPIFWMIIGSQVFVYAVLAVWKAFSWCRSLDLTAPRIWGSIL